MTHITLQPNLFVQTAIFISRLSTVTYRHYLQGTVKHEKDLVN